MGKIKLLSLFSGIGAFEKALDRIEAEYELIGYSEIDKYASKSYAAIHNVAEPLNLGDIKKIDEKKLPKDIDLITYGFPCQDISTAGKQLGFLDANGNQTRSGLFFDALRIIKATMPKVAIAENVKNLTGEKFKNEFKTVLTSLEEAGYNNYWEILNAKKYNVPQNRERVFIVSIRKNVDTGGFKFPESLPLKRKLKDVLEQEIEEKYYVSSARLNGMMEHKTRNQKNGNGFGAVINDPDTQDMSPCIRARYYKDGSESLIRVKQIANIMPTKTRDNPNQGRVYDTDGLSPALNCSMGGGRQPFIVESRKRNPENPSDRTPGAPTVQRLEPNRQGICNTLTTTQKDNYVCEPPEMRVRRLTPKECFRLMDFDDEDFAKAQKVNSNTQLYKQAGNSIVVACPMYIFKNLMNAKIL